MQQAGETLFLPEGWLHATLNLPGDEVLAIGVQARHAWRGGALEAANAVMASFVAAMGRVSTHAVGSAPFPSLFQEVALAAAEARGEHPSLAALSEHWVVEAKATSFQLQICAQDRQSCPSLAASSGDPLAALAEAAWAAVQSAVEANPSNPEAQLQRCAFALEHRAFLPHARWSAEEQAECRRLAEAELREGGRDEVAAMASQWLAAQGE